MHKPVPGLFLSAMSWNASRTGGVVDRHVAMVLALQSACSTAPVVFSAHESFLWLDFCQYWLWGFFVGLLGWLRIFYWWVTLRVTLIGVEDGPAEPRSGPKPRKIRKLSWERSKLRNIKAKLDEAYLARLTEKQRHTSAPVSRTEEESSRPHPTNGPRWAVRSGWFATFSEHLTFYTYQL